MIQGHGCHFVFVTSIVRRPYSCAGLVKLERHPSVSAGLSQSGNEDRDIQKSTSMFLQTLVTGSALTEHMEEFYLDTLRALATTEASVKGLAAEVREKAADTS